MRICTFVVSSHLAQFAFVLAAHSLSDRTEMPLGLVCVLILWVTNLTSSLKNTSPSALSTYFLELANFECWRDDFKRKAPVDRSSSRDTVVACCCCCDGADDAATELMLLRQS